MGTNLDTAKLSYGSRTFILKPPPIFVQILPVFGGIFIVAAFLGFGVSLWAGANFGPSQFVVVAGLSYALMFLGTVTIALYHLVKAALDNLQINAYRGKRG